MNDGEFFRKVEDVCKVLGKTYDNIEQKRKGEHNAQILLQDYCWTAEEQADLKETLNKHGIKIEDWTIWPIDDEICVVLNVVDAEAGE